MKANLVATAPDVWRITDGDDFIRIHMACDGIYIQRSHKNEAGSIKLQEPRFLSFDKLILALEGQKELFDVIADGKQS